MKKILTLGVILAISLVACADRIQMVAFNELPVLAQNFIDKYYQRADVTYIEKEIDGLFNEYHVRLNNGTEIEFDQQGNLEHIDCHKSAVPEGIVPQLIVDYVNLHFSNQIIVEYHREDRRQQVELNNGLELVFDREGNFLRMDD
jgi:hypothetical protein